MDVMHDAEPDIDGNGDGDGRHSSAASAPARWARHLDSRRRFRRRLAVVLAVAGIVAILVGLSWHPGKHKSSGNGNPQNVTVNSGAVTQNTAKPPTTGPGGVGNDPDKTGLPAVPAPGGRVRTGTKDQGCFSTMREYLDAWDKSGQEPDPCFTTQDPAGQSQPGGVVRSYNGEKF